MQCTEVYSLQFTVYKTVQFTVYSLQCTVCSGMYSNYPNPMLTFLTSQLVKGWGVKEIQPVYFVQYTQLHSIIEYSKI